MSTLTYRVPVQDPGTLKAFLQKKYPTCNSVITDGRTATVAFSTVLTSADITIVGSLVKNYTNPDDQTSTTNSSSTPLAASAVFTGSWEDVARFSSIVCSLSSNSGGTLDLQYGNLTQQVDRTKTYTVTAGRPITHVNLVTDRYFRVRYTNGSSAQTSFYLSSVFRVNAPSTLVTSNETVDDQNDTTLTRAIISARSDGGFYNPANLTEEGGVRTDVPRDLYQRVRTAASTQNFRRKFTDSSLSADNFAGGVTGSGSITITGGLANISSAAVTNSSAVYMSRREMQLAPGQSSQVIFSVQFGTASAGNTQLAGLGDLQNGVFVGYNGLSFGVCQRTAGVDTWTPSSSFNVDRIDGTGASGLNLVPSYPNVYCITVDGSGFGQICFFVQNDRGMGEKVCCHRALSVNKSTSTINIVGATLPCQFSSNNTTGSSNVVLKVAGFAGYTDGPPAGLGSRRSVDRYGSVIASTSLRPFLCIQNKGIFLSQTNDAPVVLDFLSVGWVGKEPITIALIDQPTLTGSNFADVSSASSLVAYDVASTAYTGGLQICTFTVIPGNQIVKLLDYTIILYASNILAIVAKTMTSGRLSVCATWIEDR